MTDATPDLAKLVFSKTDAGQKEIQSRGLGLTPKVRSTLILVDGRRTGAELAALAGPESLAALEQLLALGCISAQEPPQAPARPVQEAGVARQGGDLASLPAAESRDAKQVDMARNFMMNSVNTIFGQNMRLSLIRAIHACKTAEELRQVYPSWAEAMAGDRTGAKRLPELRDKLFAVL